MIGSIGVLLRIMMLDMSKWCSTIKIQDSITVALGIVGIQMESLELLGYVAKLV